MGVRNRIVLLTVGMIVLAGVISAVATFFQVRDISSEYDAALETQVEQKGLAWVQSIEVISDAAGADALTLVDAVTEYGFAIGRGDRESPTDAFGNGTNNNLKRVTVWTMAPDGAYQLVDERLLDEGDVVFREDDGGLLTLITAAGASGHSAARADSEDRTITLVLPLEDGDGTVLAATMSADEEFQAVSALYSDAIRNAVLLAVAIAVLLALIGGALSVFVARDLISRRRVEEDLRDQVRRDPFTRVLNHAAIVGELQELLDSDDTSRSCAVAMVDVDGMKATNDTYGHQVGDQVLLEVAASLQDEGAVVGRYGGDEFVALIPDADRAAAERYKERVESKLRNASITDRTSGTQVPMSISLGLAIYPEEAQTVMDLIHLSDNAMYASRLQRPVSRSTTGMPRRRDERAAKLVGEIVPLLTAPGELREKLRLVSHRITVGAGYDAVNFEVDTRHGFLSNTYGLPEDLLGTWSELEQRTGGASFRHLLQKTRRPVIINDVANDDRLSDEERALALRAGIHSVISAPMVWRGDFIGLLNAGSKRKDAFGSRDAGLLMSVANEATAIIWMAMMVDDLQEARDDAVLLLASAAQAHDPAMGDHLYRVRMLTQALAGELGKSKEEVEALVIAAVVHDIGKIRVPERILASAEDLTDEEWYLVRKHTIWGEAMLKGRRGFESAAVVARSHHESWDGSGYPDGLKGDAIPEGVAIVAVADAFEAMTSNRSYRQQLSPAAAVREIERCSGKQFSPTVVEALVRLHERNALREGLETEAA